MNQFYFTNNYILHFSKRINLTVLTLLSLIFLHLILLFISNNLIPTDELLRESLKKQISGERITELIKFQSEWSWLIYVTTGVIALLRIGLIIMSLKIGAILYGYKINNYLSLIIASEISYFSMNLFSLCWFLINKENLNLELMRSFTPLAISNLLNLNLVDQIFHYTLRIINVFEISFWFILAYIVSRELKIKYWKSFEFVMSTYGVGLLIWIVFVMFLTINMN